MAVENDIVLIYYEDQPLVFARIENIAPDAKKDWFQVKLLMLAVPLQTVTWILRKSYIEGAEFTMDGRRMRLEKVVCPEESENPAAESKKEPPAGAGEDDAAGKDAQVISFPHG